MGDSDIGQSLIGIHRYGPARSSFACREAHETFAKPNAKNANAILTLLLCTIVLLVLLSIEVMIKTTREAQYKSGNGFL